MCHSLIVLQNMTLGIITTTDILLVALLNCVLLKFAEVGSICLKWSIVTSNSCTMITFGLYVYISTYSVIVINSKLLKMISKNTVACSFGECAA